MSVVPASGVTVSGASRAAAGDGVLALDDGQRGVRAGVVECQCARAGGVADGLSKAALPSVKGCRA